MVKPRICSLPFKAKASDLGDEAIGLARDSGLELDEWQAYVLANSLVKRRTGTWAYPSVGVNVPRQNGKGAIIEARILAELYLVRSPLTIYSAHNFDTALEHFRRLEILIEDSADLSRELTGKKGARRYGITYGNGKIGIELEGDRRLRFRTRTKGGGRGFSCDLLLMDEAMFIPEEMHSALRPTLSARENPQIWYLGSAVDQLAHEHGIVFARVRERGLREDSGLAYFEWSIDEDNPNAVPRETIDDAAAWAQANPAMGIRIAQDYIAEERRDLGPRGFAVERLGVGDWPRTDHEASTIDLDAWAELVDDRSQVEDPVCVAFDVSPERFASVAIAGKRRDGLTHIEVIASRRGTAWVPEYLAERVKRHRPSAVVCDGYGPAASLVPALENLGVEVQALTAQEHGQACGQFVDAIEEGTLRYRPDDALEGAVRFAQTRPLGDAWAWSRRNSTGNISPLVAATLAHSASMTESSSPMVVLPAVA
jgi:phage terminase large subunit-like protein